MAPQTAAIKRHLELVGSITGVEAEAVHRCRHLPRRIKDLREVGLNIRSETRRDALGQRYVRYRLVQENA